MNVVKIDDLYITKEKFSIDVDELLERSSLNVEYGDFRDDLGGQLNTELRSLKINDKHNEVQQKFTKARGLAIYLSHKRDGILKDRDINI